MMPVMVEIEFTCPECEKVYRLSFPREEAEKILAEQEAEDCNFRDCSECNGEDA